MPMTQTQWMGLLRSDGWRREAGGKHQVKMTKQGMRPVTLPDNHRRAYSKGFEAQLRRETGLDRRPPARGREAGRQRTAGLER
jgi:hypothetical protein